MRRTLALVTLCLLSVNCAPAGATRTAASPPSSVVAQLYHDYAWEVVFADGRAWRTLLEEPRDVLTRYFDDRLADLLEQDRRCVERTKAVCNLSGSPIWNSNDPEAKRLSIAVGSDSTDIIVTFGRSYPPPDGEVVRLTYQVVVTPSGWRIHDVRFPDGGSLVELLSTK